MRNRIQAKHDDRVPERGAAPDLLSPAEVGLEISPTFVESLVGKWSQTSV